MESKSLRGPPLVPSSFPNLQSWLGTSSGCHNRGLGLHKASRTLVATTRMLICVQRRDKLLHFCSAVLYFCAEGGRMLYFPYSASNAHLKGKLHHVLVILLPLSKSPACNSQNGAFHQMSPRIKQQHFG